MDRRTGTDRRSLEDVLDHFVRNRRRIEACGDHGFEAATDLPISGYYRCRECGGLINDTQHSWYVLGRLHERRAPVPAAAIAAAASVTDPDEPIAQTWPLRPSASGGDTAAPTTARSSDSLTR